MVGQNIGKYRVADRVGRGGMGTVYRAVDETLHREVAIKVLNAELNDPEVAKRFRAEAITVARLSHPGIATIYELFQHEGQWLMVMEFVRGETLEHLVERAGPISPQRAAEMCMQALAALAHAHSMGVVHRDLKPANLMITETGSVKIMDFGIARVSGTEHLTNAGYMMGTPAYMSPEQVLGGEIDARADLYAIGVVFYRLITKSLPFKGESPFAMAQSQVNDPPTPVGTLRADLPPWVDQAIVRALAKNPAERFQSAVEFHEAFARCLAGLPLSAAYGSSAPTELMMTPARAMPTGSIRTPTGMSGGTASPYPAAPPADPSQAQTMLTNSAALRESAAVPVSDASTIPLSGAQPAARQAKAAAAPAAAKPPIAVRAIQLWKNPAVMGLVAATVLVALFGYSSWVRSRSAALPVAQEVPAAAIPPFGTVETPPGPEAVPPPSTALPLPPDLTAPGRAGRLTSPGQAGAPAPAGTSNSPSTAKPAAPVSPVTPPPGARSRGPAIDDSPLAFGDIRMVVVTGRDGRSTDAQVTFGDGRITVAPKTGGDALATIPYRQIVSGTYTKSRDPKWDPAAFSPPDKLNTPGTVLRRPAHWLVLQTAEAFAILRLEDSNWEKILAAVEARSGVKIARPDQP